jgi:formate-dependent nitrite reductase membrane component NrfD
MSRLVHVARMWQAEEKYVASWDWKSEGVRSFGRILLLLLLVVVVVVEDMRGYSHLKEEALDRIKWRNRFGRGCGPVVWQITDDQ